MESNTYSAQAFAAAKSQVDAKAKGCETIWKAKLWIPCSPTSCEAISAKQHTRLTRSIGCASNNKGGCIAFTDARANIHRVETL